MEKFGDKLDAEQLISRSTLIFGPFGEGFEKFSNAHTGIGIIKLCKNQKNNDPDR